LCVHGQGGDLFDRHQIGFRGDRFPVRCPLHARANREDLARQPLGVGIPASLVKLEDFLSEFLHTLGVLAGEQPFRRRTGGFLSLARRKGIIGKCLLKEAHRQDDESGLEKEKLHRRPPA
jgi:hypothetical protein